MKGNGSSTRAARVGLRVLVAEPGMAALFVILVFVSSLVAAAAPRAVERVSDDAVQEDLAHSAPAERGIEVQESTRIPADGSTDPFRGIRAEGAVRAEAFPPTVRGIVDEPGFTVSSTRYLVDAPARPGTVRYVTLHYQSQVEQHLSLREGRLPARTGVPYLIEIALSPDTAAALGVRLGQTVSLSADPDDPLTATGAGVAYGIQARITGLIETDHATDYWWGTSPYDPPAVSDDPRQAPRIYASVLFAPAAYTDVLTATAPTNLSYTYRFPVIPTRVDSGSVAPLQSELARLTAQYAAPSSATSGTLSTGLPVLLDRYTTARSLAVALLWPSALGLVAVAAAALALLCALVVRRRAGELRLWRSRGASPRRLGVDSALLSAALAVPAALAGLGLAVLLVPARTAVGAVLAAALVAVVAVLWLVLAVRSRVLRPLAAGPPVRSSLRRHVVETAVVVVAVIGVILLQRRGISGGGEVDPYLAAVPVLVGLAAGLVVVRLYPCPVRLLAHLSARGRGLTAFVALRRATHQSAVARTTMVVLLLAVALGVLAATTTRTIEDGQAATSWRTVGGDFRLDAAPGTRIPPASAIAEVPGVQASAELYAQPATSMSYGPGTAQNVDFFALDTTGYRAVNAGSPVAVDLPAAMLATLGAAAGTADDPLPLITSPGWIEPGAPAVGTELTAVFSSTAVHFVVVEVRDTLPGLPASGSFVIAPLAGLRSALHGATAGLPPSSVFVRAPADTAPALRAALGAQADTTTLLSRADVYSRMHDSPLVEGVVTALRLAALLATAYAVLAVMVTLTLTARSRARDLAYLRTLGLTRRQSLGATLVEQGPPVLVAAVVGPVLGVVIATLVLPGLPLPVVTGGVSDVVVDRPATVLLAAGFTAIVSVGLWIAAWVAGRTDVGTTLRIGEP